MQEEQPESDFLFWYNNPATQREMGIIGKTFQGLTRYQLVLLTLQMNILTAMSVYELSQLDLEEGEIEDDDDPGKWKPEGKGFEI